MAKPLTKKIKGTDCVLQRDKCIDAEIDEALALSSDRLKLRLAIRKIGERGFLRSETLLHLTRHFIRNENKLLGTTVITVLFERCEANLKSTISEALPDANSIRESVMEQFATLIGQDGNDTTANRLDAFECRFNRYFKFLRLDAIDKETRLSNRLAISGEAELSGREGTEAALDRLVAHKKSPNPHEEYAPSPEEILIAKDGLTAINRLPERERKALILVQILGYKPNEAAKRLGVTVRTIHSDIVNAQARLAHLKETA
jgi:predicted DNA-binding protein (UPF0251 family)